MKANLLTTIAMRYLDRWPEVLLWALVVVAAVWAGLVL